MKRLGGFIKKEIIHILRDKRTLVILIAIPVIQILLFGFVLTNEIKDARIAVLDKANDNASHQLTNKLLSSGYFIKTEDLRNKKDAEKSFQKGETKLAIVLGKDFGKILETTGRLNMQVIADATDPNTANLLVNYVRAISMDFLQNKSISYPNNQQGKLEIVPRMFYNPELKGVYMFIPGIMAMLLIIISTMMTSISLTKEKETGTMEILLISPLKPSQIIIGKVAPYFVLSAIISVIIVVLGSTIFSMPISGNILLLFFEILLYILLALSIGIFISTITESQQSAMMISLIALMLPTILLSGFIFPIENMPVILQYLSHIIPPKWFIIIIKNVMIKGCGLVYIWKETLILIFMIIFFISLTIKKFKVHLE